ncbi:phosphoenolpyruvate carboxylase [Fodinibius sp.]|uniref:phosphoenolpyruvate carboxylase n=1 Tax=Fodinibius sp. TaxID=1872440 RepID=UPI003A1035D5
MLDEPDPLSEHSARRRQLRRLAGAGAASRFLLTELERRPCSPARWPLSAESEEVLATCRTIAHGDGAGIAQYVISMAAAPSDVLAVILLLRECGLERDLPVVPTVRNPGRPRGRRRQRRRPAVPALVSTATPAATWQVMIGSSDSAKDAGQFAAAWAQYRAQDRLVAVAERYGVRLALLHGRGGAVGAAAAARRRRPFSPSRRAPWPDRCG